MLKENELQPTEVTGWRLMGEDANISLAQLKGIFNSVNNEVYNLPIRIDIDELKSGGLLKSKTEECLTITNTEHPADYFKYCITARKQVNTLAVELYYYGISTLTADYNLSQARKESGFIGKMVDKLKGFDQAAFEEEYAYYNMLKEIFRGMFQMA